MSTRPSAYTVASSSQKNPSGDAACRQPQPTPQSTGVRSWRPRPSPAAPRRPAARPRSGAIMAVGGSSGPGRDLLGEKGRVVSDPADQRRAAGVLPDPAQRVEPRRGGDPAGLPQPAPLVGDVRDVDPRVVGAESGRPHHGVVFDVGAVGEGDAASGHVLNPRPNRDAVPAGELPGAGADDLVAAGEPPA